MNYRKVIASTAAALTLAVVPLAVPQPAEATSRGVTICVYKSKWWSSHTTRVGGNCLARRPWGYRYVYQRTYWA